MSKQRILVVEDDSIFRNYLYQVLKYEYDVVAVVNPLEALAELGRGKFALMLTDLRMPEMDGRELVEKVHAEVDPNLMVILITAFEGDWPIDSALASHVFRYLRKGAFLPSELKQNVAKAIEMQRSIVSWKSTVGARTATSTATPSTTRPRPFSLPTAPGAF